MAYDANDGVYEGSFVLNLYGLPCGSGDWGANGIFALSLGILFL